MVLRETVSDLIQIHVVSYPPNTKVFRHLKQKLPSFLNNFLTKKNKNSPWNKLKLYCKD